MIDVQAACYFTITASDEAAQQLAAEISPAASLDITEMLIVSNDFESDITALITLDSAISHAREMLADTNPSLSVSEEFNPLYLPSGMEALDDMLELHTRSDNFRFTGFNGNPFTIKLVNVNNDDQQILTAQAQYHPFELPNYSDILAQSEGHFIN